MSDGLSFQIGSGNFPLIPYPGKRRVNVPRSVVTDLSTSLSNAIGNRIKTTALADKVKSGEPDVPPLGDGSNRNKPNGSNRNPNGRRPRGNRNKNDLGGGQIASRKVGDLEVARDKVVWKSTIESGLVFNPQQWTTDYYSPLFICNGQFFPKADIHSKNYYQKVLQIYVYPRYKDIAYTVNMRIASHFTLKDFVDYVNIVTEALQLYYMVDSILAYHSDFRNQNIGMIHLRNKLTPEVLAAHVELERLLLTFPIPKQLLEFIRYISQNHSLGTSTNAPIIRFGLHSLLQDSDKPDLRLNEYFYEGIFLKLMEVSTTKALLSRALKGNSEFIREEMPRSTAYVEFDDQFCTLWHNSNIAYFDEKRVKYTRTVVNKSDNCYYGAFAPDVDGTIYASSSLTQIDDQQEYDKDENGKTITSDNIQIHHTGIWKPFDQFDTNWLLEDVSSLTCFNKNNEIRACSDKPLRISSHIHAAPYQNMRGSRWVKLETGYAGCQIAQVHSIDNLSQAVSQTDRKSVV